MRLARAQVAVVSGHGDNVVATTLGYTLVIRKAIQVVNRSQSVMNWYLIGTEIAVAAKNIKRAEISHAMLHNIKTFNILQEFSCLE